MSESQSKDNLCERKIWKERKDKKSKATWWIWTYNRLTMSQALHQYATIAIKILPIFGSSTGIWITYLGLFQIKGSIDYNQSHRGPKSEQRLAKCQQLVVRPSRSSSNDGGSKFKVLKNFYFSILTFDEHQLRVVLLQQQQQKLFSFVLEASWSRRHILLKIKLVLIRYCEKGERGGKLEMGKMAPNHEESFLSTLKL